jgi:uncharacterized membrane protein YeiH
MKTLLLVLDLIGTFVFALSGAMAAVRHRLDLFGIVVLALAAATFGGISRDLLIGAVPPAALADWRYIAVPVIAGVTVFFTYSTTARLQTPVLVLDGAGLAVFAVSGALKALTWGLTPLSAVLLGMLTGVGGGIARDIIVAEIPTVLRAELYAVAALAGASIVVIGRLLQLPTLPLAAAGGALCFGLRFMAIRYGWHLPRACQSEQLTFHSLPPRGRISSTADPANNNSGYAKDNVEELDGR